MVTGKKKHLVSQFSANSVPEYKNLLSILWRLRKFIVVLNLLTIGIVFLSLPFMREGGFIFVVYLLVAKRGKVIRRIMVKKYLIKFKI